MATLTLTAEHREGMHHVATIDGFIIESDEPPSLGGADDHPKPLDYLTASIAFCTLTQIMRLAPHLGVTIEAVTCNVETDWSATGSIRRRDNRASCDGVRVETSITSPSDRAAVAELSERAEAACYVLAALREPVAVSPRTLVNGVLLPRDGGTT